MKEQQDWHCWIMFLGRLWKITNIQCGYLVHLARAEFHVDTRRGFLTEQTVMDISKVDFAAHCAAAISMYR